MDPEVVLAIVAAALCAVVVWLVAVPASLAWLRSRHPERVAWWRLVLPLFASALVFAFLLGWAIQEPDPADESVGLVLRLLALLSGGVVLRAAVRGVHALRRVSQERIPIGTIGILRPTIVLSPEFRDRVSGEVLAAALAHEAAHARRRDPLRIWLAQLAADLQWPVPGTARRFSAWLIALEAERDDEALSTGVSGGDLAEAILVAARLHQSTRGNLCAHAKGRGEGIAWRVRRLLAATPSTSRQARAASWVVPASCFMLIAAVWLGVHYGDSVLRLLPGIGP